MTGAGASGVFRVASFEEALKKRFAAKSLEAFGACLSKSTELGWFSEWSKLCEHELGQIKPEEFPTAAELHGDPDQGRPVTAFEPAAKID